MVSSCSLLIKHSSPTQSLQRIKRSDTPDTYSRQLLVEWSTTHFLVALDGMPRMPGLACITTALRHTSQAGLEQHSASPFSLSLSLYFASKHFAASSCSHDCVISSCSCTYLLIQSIDTACTGHQRFTKALHPEAATGRVSYRGRYS